MQKILFSGGHSLYASELSKIVSRKYSMQSEMLFLLYRHGSLSLSLSIFHQLGPRAAEEKRTSDIRVICGQLLICSCVVFVARFVPFVLCAFNIRVCQHHSSIQPVSVCRASRFCPFLRLIGPLCGTLCRLKYAAKFCAHFMCKFPYTTILVDVLASFHRSN